MEASQAAQGQQGDGQQQQAGPDVGQLAQQFEGLTQSQQEMMEFLRSEPWRQQEQQEGQQQDDGIDLSFLDQGAYGDPEQVAAQLQQVIQQQIQQGIQQHVNPALEKLTGDFQEDRRVREMEILVGEFPELGENKTAQEVVGLAREMAQVLGRPELADEPKFWRYAYMVGRAADAANQEGAEPPGAATLEGGGGAAPAGPSSSDLADMITGPAKGGRYSLPF